jgi:transposase
MKTTSLDLRKRIVETYDEGKWTQEEVAKRFRVSLGMVKKLLLQRSRTGQIEARHRYSGRKARLLPERGQQLKALVAKEPDLTLAQIKERLGLDYTVGAIHWVLGKLDLTYKKRRSMRPNRTVPTLRKRVADGSGAKAGSIRRNWSSSTSRRPRQT